MANMLDKKNRCAQHWRITKPGRAILEKSLTLDRALTQQDHDGFDNEAGGQDLLAILASITAGRSKKWCLQATDINSKG